MKDNGASSSRVRGMETSNDRRVLTRVCKQSSYAASKDKLKTSVIKIRSMESEKMRSDKLIASIRNDFSKVYDLQIKYKKSFEECKEANYHIRNDLTKAQKHNKELIYENKEMRTELDAMKLKLSNIVSILGKNVNDLSNVFNDDMTNDKICTICMTSGNDIQMRTNSPILQLYCSVGTCTNMYCCKACFDVYNSRSENVCFTCRKRDSKMKINEVICI